MVGQVVPQVGTPLLSNEAAAAPESPPHVISATWMPTKPTEHCTVEWSQRDWPVEVPVNIIIAQMQQV